MVSTAEDALYKLLKNIKLLKVTGIGSILEKFFKDRAWILAKSTSVLCNFFMILGSFHDECKVVKLKSLFKMGWKMNPSRKGGGSLISVKDIERS